MTNGQRIEHLVGTADRRSAADSAATVSRRDPLGPAVWCPMEIFTSPFPFLPDLLAASARMDGRLAFEEAWRVQLNQFDRQGRVDWNVAMADATFVAAKKGCLRWPHEGWQGFQTDAAGRRSGDAAGRQPACRESCRSPSHSAAAG